ncbi:MAG: siphovirus ReqiPepy6 Gp37-like family protein, partial [Saprospiraceae bacterium]|nr:siphovirus ReqiPepy6 Gp37-like family protein [Saprospiraceae bacterium]
LSNTVENIMRILVQTCCLSPEDPKRTIPLLQLGPLQGFTPTVTMQVTYRNLNQTLYQLTMTHQIGWDITLDPLAKKLNFICYQPINRSSAQTIVAKVVFSENYENLKATQYQRSQRFLSNLALVGGQGEGEERILVQVGDAEGLDRKEVFINAKDQRWEEELSEQEYIYVLIQKGWQSMQPEVEYFESEVDVYGSTRIRQDFDLGDTVSIEMSQWSKQIHVQVTEISEVFDEMGLRVIPIFGQSLSGMQNQFESDTSGSGSSSTISLPINKAVVSDSNGQLTTGIVTAQEIAMLAGVSSSLQTQLNGKQAVIIGAASSITANNLTASRATVSDASGKMAVSG